ncbi:MAG TPA: mycothiol system anti-sigma-R factor [Acidimicrobiales bacterium]|nr:mycothiol system anti-sigma-R factor [Acidimicrobiales bacterium]
MSVPGDDCGEAIHRLYHFLDGELTEDRRVEIQRHLDDCGPCLEAFDFEAELRITIAHKCREEVPESLRLRVAAAIHHEMQLSAGPGGPAPAGPGLDGGPQTGS